MLTLLKSLGCFANQCFVASCQKSWLMIVVVSTGSKKNAKAKPKNVPEESEMNNSEHNKCLWCDSVADPALPVELNTQEIFLLKTSLLRFHQVDWLIPAPPYASNTCKDCENE